MLTRVSRAARPARSAFDIQCLIPVITRSIRTRPQPRTASEPAQSQNPSSSQIPPQQAPPNQDATTPPPPEPPRSMENVLANIDDKDNTLLAPVHIPEDANAVLKSDHPATNILTQSGIVVQRQMEMMNLLVGFEQANRYIILDPHGNHIGYMAEHDGGFGKTMRRQFLHTHRPFTTHVFDRHAREVLRFDRPFSWINSRIRVYDPLEPASHIQKSSSTALSPSALPDSADFQQISSLPLDAMRIIGEAHSEWAPLRRKYSLFLSHEPALKDSEPQIMSREQPAELSTLQQRQIGNTSFVQFAAINEPFLSWDFSLVDAEGRLIGSVNRGFRGFARELFTDTGSYALRMDSVALEEGSRERHIVSQSHKGDRAYAETLGASEDKLGMTLDQRAVMLATAVTVDFDYFSRHGGGSGILFPFWIGGGGEAAGAGAAGAAGTAGAGEAVGGAVTGGVGRAVGGAAGAGGIGEGAIAGAGTMAGYEAMQRGMGRGSETQPTSSTDASPQAPPTSDPTSQSPADSQPDAPPSDFQPPSEQDGWSGQQGEGGDVWGSGNSDPWSGQGAAGDAGGGEGGGIGRTLWDMFFGD